MVKGKQASFFLDTATIMSIKFFTVQAPVSNVINLRFAVIYNAALSTRANDVSLRKRCILRRFDSEIV
jgi:hypothetical protein